MSSNIPSAAAVGRKVGHELKQFALISAYLYVCFGALILYKWAILRAEGIDYAPYGFAAIKALLLAKFILMGHMARIGDRYKRRRLIYVIAHKSMLFLFMLLVLTAIEEVVVGVVHGQTIAGSLADFAGGSLLQVLAICVLMLLILIPYLAFKELGEVLGEGRLRQILLDYRTGSPSSSRHRHQGNQPNR
jgi:hypothetical protein